MDKLVTVSIVIGLIVVGGIGVFSIYLQQDEAFVAIEKITNSNYHCLEKYEYLQGRLSEDPKSKLTEENKNISLEMLRADCHLTFRDWMPETHEDWNQFINTENNRKRNCTLYLNGEGVFTDMDIENLESWNCKELLGR